MIFTYPKNRNYLWLLIAVYTLLSAALIIGGYLFYLDQNAKKKTEINGEISAFAELKSSELIKWRKERLADADFFYRNFDFVNQVKLLFEAPANNDRIAKVENWLKPLLENHDYDAIFLSDTKGKILFSIMEQTSGGEIDSLIKKSIMTGKVTLNDFHMDSYNQYTHLSSIVPISAKKNGKSVILGALIFIINPEHLLFPIVNSWPIPSETAETVLFRKEGNNIVFLNDVNLPFKTSLNFTIPVSENNIFANIILQGKRGLMEGRDYRGKDVLANVIKIPDSPWYMISKVDKEEIYQPLFTQAKYILSFVIIMLTFVAVVIIVYWQRQQNIYLKTQYFSALEKKALAEHIDYLTKFANDIIILYDKDLYVVEANEKAISFFGYTQEEFNKLNAKDLRTASSLNDLNAIVAEVNNSGGIIFETTYKKKDNSEFTAEVSSRVLNIEGYTFYQSIVRDITERNEARDKILRLNRIYAVLSNINQVSVRVKDTQKLFHEVCRIFVEDGNFLLAWIGIFDQKKNRLLPSIHFDNKMGFVDSSPISLLEVPEFNSFKGDKLKRGEFVICPDIAKDMHSGPLRDEALRRTIRSSASLPLIIDGDLYCTFNLYSPIVEHFDNEEIHLLDRVVADISFAISALKHEDQRTKAEIALNESERRLSTLMSNLPGMAYICLNNHDWTMQFVSDGCLDLTGVKSYDLINNKPPYADLIHPEDRQMVWDGVQEGVHNHKSFEIVYRIITKDGIGKWVWEKGIGVYDSDNTLVALEGFINDITESKNSEKELRTAKEKAVHSDKLKTEFLAQMSHEIRTPLNAILSFSNYIREELKDTLVDDLKVGFASIELSSNRIIRTIDLILNMSQIQTGSYDYKPRKFDIYDHTLKNLYNEFSIEAYKKNLELILTNRTHNTMVVADEYSVGQIFSNLISNAIKYTQKGKIEILVERNDETRINVSVSDTGIGISNNFIPALFEPFSQEEQGYSRGYDGIGLGLSLVKQYADINQLEIGVESSKGKGTKFTVTFK